MKATLLLVAALVLAIGCASSDEATTTTSTGTTASTGTTTTAEKAKCGGCGKEVAKADLVSHDGMMLCKECMAAHNHG